MSVGVREDYSVKHNMGKPQAAVTKTSKNNNRRKESERKPREYEDLVNATEE